MKVERRQIAFAELQAILERIRSSLSAEEHEKLVAALDTLPTLTPELEAKGASIQRLRALLFGPSTEKSRNVLGQSGESNRDEPKSAADKKRPPGHGRNGAENYGGAQKVKIAHDTVHHGDRCPGCCRGKLYLQLHGAVIVRVTGMAPLQATVYERERLRCNLCGQMYTAPAPQGVGDKKYDESAAAMVALLRYGCGLPFNRLEKLQRNLGILLPAPTQWELVRDAAQLLAPAHDELIRQGAQGEVVHNDDTPMTVLELSAQPPQAALAEQSKEPGEERTGVHTSGIVCTGRGQQIALFFTGRKHAGENLAAVLQRRAAELPHPIQMCDALSHNTAGEFDTIVANCIAHARRQFVEVAPSFPDHCRYVLETLREVYRNDAMARERQMSPAQRLRFHQTESGPLMNGLEQWLREQIEQRQVEPNSTLGGAIGYMRKHWSKLTLFLREPGAPLDNNICERALKKAICHRKNSLFYKTENGARVGDLFMSLIHTAELAKVDPFDYLVQLQRHPKLLSQAPGQWMPWNYRDTLAALSAGPDPPA